MSNTISAVMMIGYSVRLELAFNLLSYFWLCAIRPPIKRRKQMLWRDERDYFSTAEPLSPSAISGVSRRDERLNIMTPSRAYIHLQTIKRKQKIVLLLYKYWKKYFSKAYFIARHNIIVPSYCNREKQIIIHRQPIALCRQTSRNWIWLLYSAAWSWQATG